MLCRQPLAAPSCRPGREMLSRLPPVLEARQKGRAGCSFGNLNLVPRDCKLPCSVSCECKKEKDAFFRLK